MSHLLNSLMSRRDVMKTGTLLGCGLVGQLGSPLTAHTQAAPIRAIPQPSEVCFSARTTNQLALSTAQRFGATRIDWTYSLDRAFLRSARLNGAKVIGGTVNACMPDKVGGGTYKEARALQQDGTPVAAPWMAGEPITRYWGCVNNPGYERIMLEGAMAALNAGADYLQFDDAALSIPAVKWGACWCGYCRQKADSQGYSLQDQMLSFQTASTEQFIRRFRARLNEKAGQVVMMSSNNFEGNRRSPYNLFDFGMCEFAPANIKADKIINLYQSFEQSGWYQVATLQTADPHVNRAAIATIHACGGNCIVPWDVFLGTNRRYFGLRADYLPIYDMVHRSGRHLDAKRFAPLHPRELLTADTLGRLIAANIHVVVREDAHSFIIHMIPWTEGTGSVDGSMLLKWTNRMVLKSGVGSGEARIRPTELSIPRQRWSIFTIAKA